MWTIRIDKIVGAAFCRLPCFRLEVEFGKALALMGGRMPPLQESVATNFNQCDCPLPIQSFYLLFGRYVLQLGLKALCRFDI